jgi:hypothetical protein
MSGQDPHPEGTDKIDGGAPDLIGYQKTKLLQLIDPFLRSGPYPYCIPLVASRSAFFRLGQKEGANFRLLVRILTNFIVLKEIRGIITI